MISKLTSAEEKLMLILWKLNEATISQLISEYKQPVPARTTISTLVRILEKKGCILHKSYGRFYVYYPVLPKDIYAKNLLLNLMNTYFGDSFLRLLSFYVNEKKLKSQEIYQLIEKIKYH